MVQSWELASGNAAILEMKWPWPGKFTFHFHGIPEERGAMGYFNVTNPAVYAVDGKDVAITKSISMVDWQTNLTKALQKENPNGNVTTLNTTAAPNINGMNEMGQHRQEQQAFLLQQWLTEVNHPDHTLITYPNLGHQFYPSSQRTTESGPIPEYVLADLYSWLEAHSGFTSAYDTAPVTNTTSSTNVTSYSSGK
jgi:hypothetical protein